MEQSAEVLGEFAWHVKHGAIGDHVESLTVKMIFGETFFYQGLHAHTHLQAHPTAILAMTV